MEKCMSTNKEVLEKLVKIAKNQQKIITRLAQEAGLDLADPMGGGTAAWEPINNFVMERLKGMPESKGLVLRTAAVGSQSGAVKVTFTGQSANFPAVVQRLVDSLKGHVITADSGNSVTVTNDESKFSILSST